MRTLFIDPVCPHPYNFLTPRERGLGGTESTVLKVVAALEHADLTQHNRLFTEGKFKDPRDVDFSSYKNLVVLRAPSMVPWLREQSKDAKIFVWLHDNVTPKSLYPDVEGLVKGQATIICVSEFHKTQIVEALRACGAADKVPVKRVYNPTDNQLQPDNTKVDKTKLVFFSAPQKGLEKTLHYFSMLRRVHPRFSLYVANPGYFKDHDTSGLEGVVNLGSLTQREVLKHVREALCVFNINDVYPETFGLVTTEAHAVGTPVITHAIGAALETYDHPRELVDCSDYRAVIGRVLSFENDRPRVRLKDEFRLHNIAKEWQKLLK